MSNEQSIGALWLKEGANGQYFSGQIEIDGKKISVVVFPNSYKTEDKHPDFKILLARDQGSSRTSAPSASGNPPPHTDADEPIQVNDLPA